MDTTLTLHRILKAPRMAVWECWTRPEHIVHWFMPKPHFVSEAVIELFPGGRFFTKMHVDEMVMADEGSILAAETGRRLVFTDLLSAGFQPVAEPGLGFTAEILLADHADGTDYTVHARHRTAEQAQKHEEMGFTEGWGMVADQLGAYAATLGEGK